jgi:uncharacterized protein YndB with AHSA1/START domain
MFAELVTDGTRPGLRFERRIGRSPETIWAALTTPERLADWLAPAELELTPGGRLAFHFPNGFVNRGHVRRIEPGRLLEHTWSEQSPPMSLVRWELEPAETGSRLVLTHSFHQPPPRSDLINTAASWHLMLDRLPGAAAGQAADWSGDEWQALHDGYAERFTRGRPFDGS